MMAGVREEWVVEGEGGAGDAPGACSAEEPPNAQETHHGQEEGAEGATQTAAEGLNSSDGLQRAPQSSTDLTKVRTISIIYGANTQVMRWSVDHLSNLCVATPTTEPPTVPELHRTADLTHDLTWLLVGADPRSMTYHEEQNFDYDVPKWLKDEAAKVAQALAKVQAMSFEQRIVVTVFRHFSLLVSAPQGEGKVPYGVVLGYLLQCGCPMAQHTYINADGMSVAYVLPRSSRQRQGENALVEMVEVGAAPTLPIEHRRT